MAAPNIVNVSTIYGKTAYAVVTTTMANLVINGATSGNIIKINDVIVSNYSSASITTNVTIGRGSSLFYLAGNMTVPANSTLIVLAKDSAIYMEEGDYLGSNASSASGAHISSSYEVIF